MPCCREAYRHITYRYTDDWLYIQSIRLSCSQTDKRGLTASHIIRQTHMHTGNQTYTCMQWPRLSHRQTDVQTGNHTYSTASYTVIQAITHTYRHITHIHHIYTYTTYIQWHRLSHRQTCRQVITHRVQLATQLSRLSHTHTDTSHAQAHM